MIMRNGGSEPPSGTGGPAPCEVRLNEAGHGNASSPSARCSRGQVYLSPGVSRAVMEVYRFKSEKSKNPLTLRERQVLQLIAEGKSTKDIASLLGISVKTVESHRTRLMHKLGIHEIASLVRYAVRQGIVQP